MRPRPGPHEGRPVNDRTGITIKRRMLKAIRVQIQRAEHQAERLAQDPDKHRYAPLFDHAVRFWQDVCHTVSNDNEPSDREQAFVIGKIRESAAKDGK